jgi:arabinan endo-1,5-alpha-L-arabinosidase
MATLVALAPGTPGTENRQPSADPLAGMRHVHDPCAMRDREWVYVFSTGPGIPIRRSRDLIHWELAGRVFAENVPPWAKEKVPRATGIWAPDIAYARGRYWLTYSVSTFGSNHSAIGLATNVTLDPADPRYRWMDQGVLIESQRSDNYNAIDSQLVFDGPRAWLAWGSFWSGLKMIAVEPATGKPRTGAPIISLAQRPPPDALEAPFLIRRGRWWYLLASYDYCCRGVNSTYNIRVGRSRRPEGPYVDRAGKPMLQDGGTPLLATKGRVIGPGHCGVLRDRGRDWLVHHFYDGEANGVPTLQVRPLRWARGGWPVAGEPVGAPPAR